VREHDLAGQLKAMPDDELKAIQRDLQAGIGLMRPHSPMHQPARVYLVMVLSQRH
jgi:hypothetical protein